VCFCFIFPSFLLLFFSSSYSEDLLSAPRTAPVPMQPVSVPGAAAAAAAADPAAAKDDTPATLIKAGGGS